MEIKDIRRTNLRSLVKKFTNQGKNKKSQFADRIGIPAAQLSQISSENPIRNIGNNIARRIEKSLDLPTGWMDKIHTENASQVDKSNHVTLKTPHDVYTNYNYKLSIYDKCEKFGGEKLNNESTDIIKSLEISPDYAKEIFGGRLDSALAIITFVGDSMSDTIDPGSLIVIDKTIKEYIGDGIYAFTAGGNMHVKRLQLAGNKLIVISDNAAYHKWETKEENLYIDGFVIGKWNINYTRLG